MRKVFINKSVVPPGGFVYVEPASGVEFRHTVFDEILNRVRLHRIANGFPLPPGWQDEVESAMCEHHGPETWQFVDESSDNREPRRVHISDVLNFVAVVRAWVAAEQGEKFVSPEEAERRAEICAGCPYNQAIDGCQPCQDLAGKVYRLLGGRTTKWDHMLKGCAICSCSGAQVHITLRILHKGVPPEMNEKFPTGCWKKV